MNANNPLVSIIMPAYNSEKYIDEAIQSVIEQTYLNWELLITDDGSTDKTTEIIKTFTDSRIVLYQQENNGVSSARNKSLDVAKGKYITFLDADDLLPPLSLEARVNYLESNLSVDLVDGRVIGKDIDMQNDIRIYQPYYTGKLLPRLVALDDCVFFNVCYMFKREILSDTSFTDKMTHAEDLLFYMELSNKYPVEYGFVSDIIYWYRSGHVSAMTNLDGLEKGYLLLLSKVRKFKGVSYFQYFKLRLRIVRILFFSWLKRKEILRAFRFVFSAIVTVS